MSSISHLLVTDRLLSRLSTALCLCCTTTLSHAARRPHLYLHDSLSVSSAG